MEMGRETVCEFTLHTAGVTDFEHVACDGPWAMRHGAWASEPLFSVDCLMLPPTC